MTDHRTKEILFCIVAVAGLASFPAFAQPVSCSNIQVHGTFTMQSNYVNESTTDPCFRLAGLDTLDMDGHTITCDTDGAGDCAVAVQVNGSGAKVKDGTIDGSDVDSFVVGIDSDKYPTVGSWDTHVQNVIVDGAGTAVYGAEKIENSVFKNITVACVGSPFRWPGGNSAFVKLNYCESSDDGMLITGPVTSGSPNVEKNYIRAANDGLRVSGNLDVEKNIIDAATPLTVTTILGYTPALSQNVCDDSDCEEPDDTPFTLNVNW